MRSFLKKNSGMIIFFIVGMLFPIVSYSAERLDTLMVFGQGFMFGVKEPIGWIGNTEDAAEYGGNVVFYKNVETLANHTSIIIVRVNDKTDEHTENDLKYDMEQSKTVIPNITFKDFKVTHPIYKCYPKIFIVEKKYTEYVVYINPGKDNSKIMFSVTLHVEKRAANKEELDAYQKIVGSIRIMNTGAQNKK